MLSVIIPAFNERLTLPTLLAQVLALPVDLEVFVVNDASTDGTQEYLKEISDHRVTVIHQVSNRGKGTAIRTALPHVRGQFVAIQDADLEYNPRDLLRLLNAVGQTDGVVYGSRNLTGTNRKSYWRYWAGGVLLSYFANWLYGLRLTDIYTCLKLFRTDILQSLDLRGRRFELCAEITAKLAKRGIRIHEIPIGYVPRTFKEGKKINAIDGSQAIWILIKYRFID
jgi:dolichol-phosphate mannosyltransferase